MNKTNEDTTVREIYFKGWIDSLKLERIDVHSVEKQPEGHYIATIYGGLNGPGSWEVYIRQICMIVDSLSGSWVIDLINDCLDDIWTLRLGFRLEDVKRK